MRFSPGRSAIQSLLDTMMAIFVCVICAIDENDVERRDGGAGMETGSITISLPAGDAPILGTDVQVILRDHLGDQVALCANHYEKCGDLEASALLPERSPDGRQTWVIYYSAPKNDELELVVLVSALDDQSLARFLGADIDIDLLTGAADQPEAGVRLVIRGSAACWSVTTKLEAVS